MSVQELAPRDTETDGVRRSGGPPRAAIYHLEAFSILYNLMLLVFWEEGRFSMTKPGISDDFCYVLTKNVSIDFFLLVCDRGSCSAYYSSSKLAEAHLRPLCVFQTDFVISMRVFPLTIKLRNGVFPLLRLYLLCNLHFVAK